MGPSHQDEIERKFDVSPVAVFPNLAETEGVHSVGQPREFRLEAVYFDTPALDLARTGVTLRRRTGGTDAGWHLKLPAGPDTRTELREPLGRVDTVPAQLRTRVRAIVRGRVLEPAATITTDRREYPLRASDGALLALVCDDRVKARRLGGPEPELLWREWEVELRDASSMLLDAVEKQLLGAGASRAATSSKLARVLGAPPPPAPPLASISGKTKVTVQQLLQAQLAQYLGQLMEQDAGVRAEQAEAVHRLRIAARRLRSTLTTFRPLLDTAVTDPMREELRWLGESLGPARDAQVLREHLAEVLASEPAELVIGPVAARLDDELGAASKAGRAAAVSALDSDRYVRLLDTIDEVIATPPLVRASGRAAREEVPALLARDVQRLRRAVRAVEEARDPAERDAAFHEARKKAKRLRYAAETAAPVLGRRARSLAASTKRVQETLGIHQDSVVARRRLREYGIKACLEGGNTFTIGRLHALEQTRAERAEADFIDVWATFTKKRLRPWAG